MKQWSCEWSSNVLLHAWVITIILKSLPCVPFGNWLMVTAHFMVL